MVGSRWHSRLLAQRTEVTGGAVVINQAASVFVRSLSGLKRDVERRAQRIDRWWRVGRRLARGCLSGGAQDCGDGHEVRQ